MTPSPSTQVRNSVSRRAFLGFTLGAAATMTLASCAPSGPTWLAPDGPEVRRAERRRTGTGRTTSVALTASATSLDLAGATASTWAFGSVPAPVIRLTAGDTLRAMVRNELPVETSVHWHGLALRNDMDGVPGVTQVPISTGKEFEYRFIAPDPGTYWFHPHVIGLSVFTR